MFVGTVNVEGALLPQVCIAVNLGMKIHAKGNSKSTAHLIFEATATVVKKINKRMRLINLKRMLVLAK